MPVPIKADDKAPPSDLCLWKTDNSKPVWCSTISTNFYGIVDMVDGYIAVGMWDQSDPLKPIVTVYDTTGKSLFTNSPVGRFMGLKFIADDTLIFQTDDGATVNTNNFIATVSGTPAITWTGVEAGYLSPNSECKNQFIVEDLYGGQVLKYSGSDVTSLITFQAETDYYITFAYQSPDCKYLYLGQVTPNFAGTLLKRYNIDGSGVISYIFPNSTADQDEVSHIDVTDKFESVCIWGDKSASFPQWYIFDIDAKLSNPTTYQFQGSAFQSFFLSDNGNDYYIVASKGTHANEWGMEFLDMFQMTE